MSKKIVALWDEYQSPWTLGKGLMFLEEINDLIQKKNINDVDLIWCSEKKPPPLFDLPAWVEKIFHYTHPSLMNKSFEEEFVWGLKKPNLPFSYNESFLYLQNSCGNQLPILKPKEKWKKQAEIYIQNHAGNKKTVIVHLKQNALNTLSNAQLKEWKQFIQAVSDHFTNFHFIAIGNEKPTDLLELPNFSWTGGEDICLDLTLIHEGDLFMGMSSGPCQMAMFNSKPYVIFKHPGHHTEEMKKEFSGRNHFSFNNNHQKFLIAKDDYACLLENFESLTKYVRI